MARGITQLQAASAMAQVRRDVRLFDKYMRMGKIKLEENMGLARQAYVRATVLSQLDLPEEREDRAGDMVLEFDQFTTGVYALAGVMGVAPIDFHSAVEKLVVSSYPVDVDMGVATVSTLQAEGHLVGADASVRLHRTYATYDSKLQADSQVSLLEDERVAAYPVYPADVVAACDDGCVDDDTVVLSKDNTGALVMHEDGVPYLREQLPEGPYALRYGSGRHMSKRKFLEVIAQVHDLAALMRVPGYCYLLAVPMGMRGAVAKFVSAYPTAGELRRLLPRGGQWCNALAKGHVLRGDYHLTASGALPPDIPSSMRVGSGAVEERGEDVAEHELRSALRRLEDLGGASRVGIMRQSSATVPRQVAGSSRFTISVDNSRSVGFSGVNQVAVLPDASELFEASSKHVKRDDAFVARLDAGPPISDSYYRRAENRRGVGRYLPATRTSKGRTVLLPEMEHTGSATTGSWRSMEAAPGWSLSRLSLRAARPGDKYDLVVSAATAARLDCNAASPVVVGGVQVPGASTAVWFQTGIKVGVGGQGGSLVMAVPRSGSATGPGWLAATAVSIYKCPYVKAHEDALLSASDVVLLTDTKVRSMWGVVRTEGSVNLRDTGLVPIRVSTAGGRTGMGVFVFSGRGLRSLTVAGVVIPASGGVVCAAIEGWETNVQVSVTAPGKYKVVADFVADPATFEEKLRPSPVTPTLPNFGFH